MNRSDQSLDWELLLRYDAGETAGAESERAEELLREFPRAAALLQGFHEATRPLAEPASLLKIEHRYAALQHRLGAAGGEEVGAGKGTSPSIAPQTLRASPYATSRHRGSGYRLYGSIAALLVCLIGGMGWLLTRSHAMATLHTAHEYTTKSGQRATITLADGSTVILGPESRLQVGNDFGSSSRTISLTGSALFTVVHASDASLVVRARNTVTRVLGTTFAIRDYATDSSVQVVVAQGRVMVGRSAILSTGDLARVTSAGEYTFAHHVDIAAALEWTQGKLTFDHVPFRTTVPDLDRQYDIDIQIADSSIAAHTITAAFSTQSTEDVLSELAILLDAHVVRHGRTIVFTLARGADTGDGDFWPLETRPSRRTNPLAPSASASQFATQTAPSIGQSR